MNPHARKRLLDEIKEKGGAVGYRVVRDAKHTVVEFFDRAGRISRQVIAKTPSDHRGTKNLIARLRRDLSGK